MEALYIVPYAMDWCRLARFQSHRLAPSGKSNMSAAKWFQLRLAVAGRSKSRTCGRILQTCDYVWLCVTMCVCVSLCLHTCVMDQFVADTQELLPTTNLRWWVITKDLSSLRTREGWRAWDAEPWASKFRVSIVLTVSFTFDFSYISSLVLVSQLAIHPKLTAYFGHECFNKSPTNLHH